MIMAWVGLDMGIAERLIREDSIRIRVDWCSRVEMMESECTIGMPLVAVDVDRCGCCLLLPLPGPHVDEGIR